MIIICTPYTHAYIRHVNVHTHAHTLTTAGIPRDGVPETITTTVALPLTIIYCVLTFCGIMLVLVCFIFNVVFRNRK